MCVLCVDTVLVIIAATALADMPYRVGSLSAQGADSAFFNDTLTRVGSSLGCTDVFALKARSFQISSDMAHAVGYFLLARLLFPTHTYATHR